MSRNLREQELGLPPCTALSIGTADAFGRAVRWTRVRPFTSRFRPPGREATSDSEPRHTAGRRQPKRRRTDFASVREEQRQQRNRGGRGREQAIHYLFKTGPHAGRDPKDMPEVVLLDMKLPKLDGLGVLRRMRADERTRRLPVVILTSSKEEKDVMSCYDFGANSFVRKPVDFGQFVDAARHLGIYWLVMNEPPPPGQENGDGR